MKKIIRNYGFQKPQSLEGHWMLGNKLIPQLMYQPSGQWGDFLPIAENQFKPSFDTYGCTVFGTLNALEIMKKRITGSESNYSDRFTYAVSETRPPGNDPHVVAEAIRTCGLLLESVLPFSDDIDTLEKFYSLAPEEQDLINQALMWLREFEFNHEWLFTIPVPAAKIQSIFMDKLRYSPIGVSVRAWQQRDNGLYFKEIGEEDTHWPVIFGYKKGEYWECFDSYPDEAGTEVKHLEWNYPFGCAKRYHLAKKDTPDFRFSLSSAVPRKSAWLCLANFLRSLTHKKT